MLSLAYCSLLHDDNICLSYLSKINGGYFPCLKFHYNNLIEILDKYEYYIKINDYYLFENFGHP